MENEDQTNSHLEVVGDGVGEISRQTFEDRALELARMDGRETWNALDLQAAQQELGRAWEPSTEPELVAPILGELVEWDENPESDGHAVPRTPLENEENAAEILIHEGIEEAEHDTRLAQDPPTEIE